MSKSSSELCVHVDLDFVAHVSRDAVAEALSRLVTTLGTTVEHSLTCENYTAEKVQLDVVV